MVIYYIYIFCFPHKQHILSMIYSFAIRSSVIIGYFHLFLMGFVLGRSNSGFSRESDSSSLFGFDPFKATPMSSIVSSGTSNSLADPFEGIDYKLKVATFNIWGLVTSQNRESRVSAITRYFAKNPRGLDILCLQELWMADDYRTVRAALSLEFPHAHYFKSGVVGSGLAVFSKYPIEEAWWKGFTLTGKAHRIFDGDWYAGKGVGAVRIKHPMIGSIDVFNTHVRKLANKRQFY